MSTDSRGVEGDGRDEMVSRGRPRCFEEVEMGIFVTSSHVVDLSVCPLDHLGSSTKKICFNVHRKILKKCEKR